MNKKTILFLYYLLLFVGMTLLNVFKAALHLKEGFSIAGSLIYGSVHLFLCTVILIRAALGQPLKRREYLKLIAISVAGTLFLHYAPYLLPFLKDGPTDVWGSIVLTLFLEIAYITAFSLFMILGARLATKRPIFLRLKRGQAVSILCAFVASFIVFGLTMWFQLYRSEFATAHRSYSTLLDYLTLIPGEVDYRVMTLLMELPYALMVLWVLMAKEEREHNIKQDLLS